MYRILDDLEWSSGRKLAKGSIDSLQGVGRGVLAVLEERGVISRVQAPPLEVIPGWKERAEELSTLGVEDVDDLLEADLSELAEGLDTPLEELEQSADEALQYIR